MCEAWRAREDRGTPNIRATALTGVPAAIKVFTASTCGFAHVLQAAISGPHQVSRALRTAPLCAGALSGSDAEPDS